MSSSKNTESSVMEEIMKDEPECLRCSLHWCTCNEKQQAQEEREITLRNIALKTLPKNGRYDETWSTQRMSHECSRSTKGKYVPRSKR
jgi:uncharacterized protein with ATP-grasp and redox domains